MADGDDVVINRSLKVMFKPAQNKNYPSLSFTTLPLVILSKCDLCFCRESSSTKNSPLVEMNFKVKGNDAMGYMMKLYAEQCDVPLEKISFVFNQKVVKSTHTPDSLGFSADA